MKYDERRIHMLTNLRERQSSSRSILESAIAPLRLKRAGLDFQLDSLLGHSHVIPCEPLGVVRTVFRNGLDDLPVLRMTELRIVGTRQWNDHQYTKVLSQPIENSMSRDVRDALMEPKPWIQHHGLFRPAFRAQLKGFVVAKVQLANVFATGLLTT